MSEDSLREGRQKHDAVRHTNYPQKLVPARLADLAFLYKNVDKSHQTQYNVTVF